MNKEKADEIMSKVLSYWDETKGIENCDENILSTIYKAILLSPHEDGKLPTQILGQKELLFVPLEEIILFGLKGSNAQEIYGDILPTLKDGVSNRQSNATSKSRRIVPNSSIKLTKND